MIVRYGVPALLLVSILATGCATVERAPLSPEAKSRIKTVALVAVDEPEKYFLIPGQMPAGSALYMFGALGGLVLGGIEASRAESATNEFTAAVKPTHPDVARHWNDSIAESLQTKGYVVTRLPRLSKKHGEKELDCTPMAGKFDAVLLTSISAGYAVESSVEPRVVALVRLASSNCTDTHFSDGYLYSARPIGEYTHIERDPKFAFASRDALMADPQTAKQALRTGLAEIARRAASAL